MSNTIYDEDGTIVEIIGGNTPPFGDIEVPPDYNPTFYGKEYSVNDIIDTLAGYMSPSFSFDKSERNGNCIVCSRPTFFKIRKLCTICMGNYINTLYSEAKNAISKNKNSFYIE